MNQVPTNDTVADGQLQAIDALDLEPIVYKLMHPEIDEKGITLEDADRLVSLYRNFLKICAMYPDKSIVPSKELDPAWHAHILDTEKYRSDCVAVFGKPLDHFPYLGLRGPEDLDNLKKSFAETRELFRHHFGVSLISDSSDTGASMCDGNGTGCEKANANVREADRARPRPVRF